MRRLIMLIIVLASAACSASERTVAPSADEAAFRASIAGTYVLTDYGPLKGAPFVLFDRMCGANHDQHLQQMLLGDTIVLGADGTARRAFTLGMYTNGTTDWENYDNFPGSWTRFDATGWAYFGGHPTLDIVQHLQNGTSLDFQIRVESDGSLSLPSGLGGSCVGSPEANAQNTINYYRRI
jgi:hypothetical protein